MFDPHFISCARSPLVLVLALILLAAPVSAFANGGGDAPGAVVSGRVVAAEGHWTADHRNIETTARIAVDDVLEGSVGGATVQVTVPGGTVGNLTQVVAGSPALAAGAAGRFTLRADGGGNYAVTGAAPLASGGAASGSTAAPAALLAAGPVIASVSPQIASAGTGTVVTITGTGFGPDAPAGSPADVGFTSYNGVYWASGRTNPEANPNEIVSWSDTEIRVRVPIGNTSDGYAVSASSGTIRVVTNAGLESNEVPFAVSFGAAAERWSGGPVFVVNDNCPGVAGGAAAVRRAADTWNAVLPAAHRIDCSGSSANTTFGNDGESLIAWGDSDAITYWYYEDGTIAEADIILSSSGSWTTGVAGGSVYSIEAWVLNCLGFCIGVAPLFGEEPQGPSDTAKVCFLYQDDYYGNMNLVTLHPADRAAAAYLYDGGPANPPLLAAAFTADRITGPAPLAVQFGDASLGGATGWVWDFGDGGTSSLRNPAHTYAAPGSYTVTLTASAPDHPDDTIRAIGRITVNASVLAVPPGAALPTDPNGDGKYEDVNGNGRPDFADVVLYFNQMTWIAANEPVSLFDYNGNDRIDFADVVWLFNHI